MDDSKGLHPSSYHPDRPALQAGSTVKRAGSVRPPEEFGGGRRAVAGSNEEARIAQVERCARGLATRSGRAGQGERGSISAEGRLKAETGTRVGAALLGAAAGLLVLGGRSLREADAGTIRATGAAVAGLRDVPS